MYISITIETMVNDRADLNQPVKIRGQTNTMDW